MTWNPIWPWPLVILVTLAIIGFAVWSLVTSTTRNQRIGWIIRTVAVLLIGLACLRPGIGQTSSESVQRAVDVVFVVDVTSSMAAEDWDGEKQRLEGVRADIHALTEAHAGARFSLITFSSDAQQRLPFTSDASAVIAAADSLVTEITRYSRGSSIGIAASTLQGVLENAHEKDPTRARVVYYLGDGEQTAATDPESFAGSAQFVTAGSVLGYGTANGGRMLENTGLTSTQSPRYIRDGSRDAVSKIDEAALKTIAGQLGVEYQHREANSAPVPANVDAAEVIADRPLDVEYAFEVYWMLTIAAFALLLWDVWRMTDGIMQLRASRGEADDD